MKSKAKKRLVRTLVCRLVSEKEGHSGVHTDVEESSGMHRMRKSRAATTRTSRPSKAKQRTVLPWNTHPGSECVSGGNDRRAFIGQPASAASAL